MPPWGPLRVVNERKASVTTPVGGHERRKAYFYINCIYKKFDKRNVSEMKMFCISDNIDTAVRFKICGD